MKGWCYIMKCETCGKKHDGSYGSGRFCCAKCARAFSYKHVTEDGRKRQREALNDKENRIKAHNSMMENSKNYELDDSGQWKRITKSQKKKKNNDVTYKHTMTIGKVGELTTAKKFLEHGYNVYIPLIDIDGTDLVVEKNDGLKKIQVKSSSRSTSEDHRDTQFELIGNRMVINNGSVKLNKRKYNKKSVDYFALYSIHDQDVYLIENDEKRKSITIRTSLSDNDIYTVGKNLEKLHMAEDYQIDKVLNDIDMGINRNNIIEVTEFADNTGN